MRSGLRVGDHRQCDTGGGVDDRPGGQAAQDRVVDLVVVVSGDDLASSRAPTTGATGNGGAGNVAAVEPPWTHPSDVAVHQRDRLHRRHEELSRCSRSSTARSAMFAGVDTAACTGGADTSVPQNLTSSPQTSDHRLPHRRGRRFLGQRLHRGLQRRTRQLDLGCLDGNVLSVTNGRDDQHRFSPRSRLSTLCARPTAMRQEALRQRRSRSVGRAGRRRQRLLQRCRQRRRGRGHHLGLRGLKVVGRFAASSTTLRRATRGQYTGDSGRGRPPPT